MKQNQMMWITMLAAILSATLLVLPELGVQLPSREGAIAPEQPALVPVTVANYLVEDLEPGMSFTVSVAASEKQPYAGWVDLDTCNWDVSDESASDLVEKIQYGYQDTCPTETWLDGVAGTQVSAIEAMETYRMYPKDVILPVYSIREGKGSKEIFYVTGFVGARLLSIDKSASTMQFQMVDLVIGPGITV